ncbi:glycine receptor subunit alpha-2-like [Tachypleus tridentatus]|uniref:glycine receptor subunit alpha-2-like n=1 Tax=Tachypleus tridentatus TaxID=6853 RepID=UPI003FD68C1B
MMIRQSTVLGLVSMLTFFWSVVSARSNRSECSNGKNPFRFEYDQSDLPPLPENGPLRIKTQLYVEDINSINALDMDFRLDFFIWHGWNATKSMCCTYRNSLENLGILDVKTSEFDYAIISKNHFKFFWIPDTYVVNAKKVNMPSKASSTEVLKVKAGESRECQLEYTVRLAAVVGCQMEFRHYPVDIQVCPFTLRSYSYPDNIVDYEWVDEDKQPDVNQDLKLLQHNFYLRKGSSKLTTLKVTYSTIAVNFTFERQIAHHVVQVFAPSALIVMLSWFSFWMGLDAIPGRVTLCVTSLLSLFTQFSGIRNDLPAASYINGIDIWMATCMLFVFATLMEFIIIKFLDKQRQIYFRKQVKSTLFRSDAQMDLSTYDIENGSMRNFSASSPMPKMAWNVGAVSHRWFKPPSWSLDWVVKIDHASRAIFPVAFLVFNTLYWPILLTRQL